MTNQESVRRVILSRALSVLAVLLLYRVPDVVAFSVLGAGGLIYMIPRPAAAPCALPKWLRTLWILSGLLVCGVYGSTDIAAPPPSVVPPVLAYGLLLLIAVQIVWDVVRNRMLRQGWQGASGVDK